jgi:nicotinamide mononucleotide transporter
VIAALLVELRATSALEAISVILGLLYLILIMWRSRWGWLAGGASSAILCYLAVQARLPMQAALQIYYVGMSLYGFWYWSKQSEHQPVRVTRWPWKFHAAACIGILAVSAATARLLASETQAAWPFLDSLTTWGSLFTAWLVARAKLENWLYWLVFDTLLAYLFAQQGLYFIALLNVIYLGIVIGGFFKWLRLYRAAIQTS